MRLHVSQRHVSFVESGRARPSRELLAAWLEELGAPLVLRNEAMLRAGYAPAYSSVPLHDPALAEANHALERLLGAHDPLPALVIDAGWNVLRLNRGTASSRSSACSRRSERPGTLRVEHLFAADEATRAVLVAQAGAGPADA